MTKLVSIPVKGHHLFWIYAGSLTSKLDSASWLDTTNELRKLGWQVTLVAAGPTGRKNIRGVEVDCVPMPQIYLLRQLFFHARVGYLLALNWYTTDVVLFHSISLLWILPFKIFRLLRRETRPIFIMDVRTAFMMPEGRQQWKDRVRKIFYRMMEQLANHSVDGTTAITKRMVELIGISADKLLGTWPSGVNPEMFTPAYKNRKWPQKGEPIHLIYVGILHYERNLLSLCKAVEKANADGMSFILSLLGEGNERLELEKFALQSDGCVQILPPVTHDEIPKYLSQAHIGVLPFPDEERFRVSSPIKLFEYLAAGMPILASRITCHTDVIHDDKFTFWVNQTDVIGLYLGLKAIWGNQDNFREMGEQAIRAAREWTWQKSAAKLSSSLDLGIDKLQS